MIFRKFLRLVNYVFKHFWLFFQIYWEMHVHYLRLYRIRVLVDKYFEAWRLLHFPEKWELANRDVMRFRTITIGKRFLLLLVFIFLLITKTSKLLGVVYGVCLATTIRTLQMTLSMTVKMTTHWRILFWDQMLFQNAIPQLNLIYVIITPFCIFYYHRMYFYRGGKMGRIETIWLSGLVINGKGDPRYRNNKSVMYVDCSKVQKAAKTNIYFLQYWNLYMGEKFSLRTNFFFFKN